MMRWIDKHDLHHASPRAIIGHGYHMEIPMYSNVIVPHYAAEHHDHTKGRVISTEKLLDCHKEIRDIGDGIYRVSVYKPMDEQTEWDFEEFASFTQAHILFESLDSYEDLTDRHNS